MKKKVLSYQLVDHGIEHSQFFQGCGVAFTSYTDVATGIGNDAEEAIEDALDQLATMDVDVGSLPSAAVLAKRCSVDVVPEWIDDDEYEDCYYYVSIRVKLAEEAK